MSRQLQKASVTIVGDQTCRKFYPIQISPRMLCAGFMQGGVDSCSVSIVQILFHIEHNYLLNVHIFKTI